MKLVGYIFLGIVFTTAILFGAQFLVIYQYVKRMSYDSKPFDRKNSIARVRFLFIGDSTAVGTGAASNKESVAGYFGQAFPDAEIDNDSYNGRKLYQVIEQFPSPKRIYDLVVVQIGANDIMQLTPFDDIDRSISTVITKAKKIGRHVVILHSGNVGLAPVFIWPVNWIMTERSRVVRQIYMKRSKEQGALYVDLFTERGNDLFLKDIPKFYAPDHLHPSGQGYRWWYQRIQTTLDRAGVVL